MSFNIYIKTESAHPSPDNLWFVLVFPGTSSHGGFHDSGSLETLVEVSLHEYSAYPDN